MKWTTEQLKVINASDSNMIVSASAGSGKTTVMVERILTLVRKGVSLDRMLVSTFTKSSAADMREKMYMALSKESNDSHIARQLEILPQADITNLHSWYQRLIKKYFYVMGIDPAFEIIEEKEANLVLLSLLDRLISDKLENGGERFLKLYEYLRSNRGDSQLRNYIVSIYKYAMTRADPDEWFEKADKADPEGWKRTVFDVYIRNREELRGRIMQLRQLCLQAEFNRNLAGLESIVDYLDFKCDSVKALGGKVPPEFIDLNECYKRLKAEAVELRSAYDETLAMPCECSLGFKTELLLLAKELYGRYIAEKTSRSLLDFDDLEHICAKLVSDTSVSREIINSYDYVFVDEYQDINPLQEFILEQLAGHSVMFYVGDIKQSIYAFRGCEPSIFLKRYLRYRNGDGGIAVELNENFRSGKVITDYCNDVMSGLMSKDFGGSDYSSSAMLKSDKEGQGSVKAYIFKSVKKTAERAEQFYDIGSDELTYGEDREAEAAADYILRLISDGAKLNDICVLVRAMSPKTEALKSALSHRGIPGKYGREEKFTERKEIMPIVSYLKLLNNYRDEYALVAVMRSVFGGFTDEQLAKIALCEGEDFYSKSRDFTQAEIGDKCRNFWQKVDEYYEYSCFHTVYETVNKLIYENDYFKYVFSDTDRDAPEALNAFLEHLSACKFSDCIYQYLNYIKSASPIFGLSEKSDAVNIMTIHKSKGLEFEHVLLFNVSQNFLGEDYTSSMILDESGIHLKEWDEENHVLTDTLDHRAAACGKKFVKEEEELRLLYVALTRAKQSLAIFATVKEGYNAKVLEREKACWDSKSALEFLDSTLDKITMPFASVEDRTLREERVLLMQKDDNDIAKQLKARFEFAAPEDRHVQKSYVTKLAESGRPVVKQFSVGEDSLGSEAAMFRGTAYHKVMELLDFGSDFDRQWQALSGEYGQTVDYGSIKKAFEVVSDLCRGKEYYKEIPFTYNSPATVAGGKSGTVLIQGVIDLMIVEEDGITIIDYKTSRPDKLYDGAYKIQLEIYGNAASSILGKDIKERLLYSFILNKFISV